MTGRSNPALDRHAWPNPARVPLRLLCRGGGAIDPADRPGAVLVTSPGRHEVVRIDAPTRRVRARIAGGLAGPGGDIGFGARRIWPTLSGTPLTEIDARTGLVRRQWVGPGGDSLAWAFDSIWLTDYKAGTVSRYRAATLGVR